MFEKFESKSRLQFYFVKLFENNEKEAGDGPFLKSIYFHEIVSFPFVGWQGVFLHVVFGRIMDQVK